MTAARAISIAAEAAPAKAAAAGGINRLLLNPVALNTSIWVLIGALYSLRLSRLLIIPVWRIWEAVAIICAGFLAGSLSCQVIPGRRRKEGARLRGSRPWLRLGLALLVWGAGEGLEIYLEGGVPLLWRLEGSGKSYIDFSVASLHGVMASILLALGLTGFYLYLRDRSLMGVFLACLPLAWAVVAIERSLFMFVAVEYSLLWILQRRISWVKLLQLAGIAAICLWLFGLAGNLRSGYRALVTAAQIVPWAAGHIPGPLLWAYAYLVTPINNLLYTALLRAPAMNWFFPNTISILLPSFLRHYLVADARLAAYGILVSPQMTVSTAYVSSYQDLGWIGVGLYAAFWGMVCTLVRRWRGEASRLVYCVLAMSILASVFFNYYLYLAVITQCLWLFLFLMPHRREVGRGRRGRPAVGAY